ncbi:MAG: fibronectin type III domain-containing protein [Lachnospiraceae bacterium]|nr:fibronectin type III domain-containing protein [Lachnospiraceae bacterium]
MTTERTQNTWLWKGLALLAAFLVLLTVGGTRTLAATNPGKVTGLKQTSASSSSFKIEWTSIIGSNIYYETYVSYTSGELGTKPDSYDVSYSNDYVSGLNAGTSFYVTVRAYVKEYDSSEGGYVYTYGDYSDQIEVVTAPENPTDAKQTKASTSSVTLTRTASDGATGYKVKDKGYDGTTLKTTSSTSAKVKASTGSYETYYVFAYRKSSAGYVAYSSSYAYCSAYASPNKPTNVASASEGNLTWKPTSSNKVTVYWDRNSKDDYTPDGYQIQIYDVTGKTKLKTYTISDKYTTYKSFNLSKVKNKGFQIRARAYVKINGTKYYSSWTSKKVIVPQANITLTQTGKTSLKVSWKKVSNATNYIVYVCKNTSATNPSWKKYKTVSKSTLSCKITGLTSKKNVGVYVIPKIKVNGKSYKASATWYLYTYMYTSGY